MTPEEFHARHQGWGRDVDGVAGVQCVDLFKEFLRIIGVPNWSDPIGGDGYADNIWYNRQKWAKWFDFIKPGHFRDGDMVLFPHAKRGGKTHKSSHVCFFYSPDIEFGTNQSISRRACDKRTNYSDALGALRWKGWEKMELKDGYQELSYNGQKIKVYKQSGKEKIAIIACRYGTVIDITKFNIPTKSIKCIVNANYFLMNGDGGYLGRVQGYLNGTLEHVDARPASPAEKGEKADKAFMDLVLTKHDNISFGDFNSWDYPMSEVVFGTSPAGIEIANGVSVDKYSPEVGYKKISTPNTQTMLMRCSDGKFALGVVEGKLAPVPSLRTWGLIYGLDHLSVYDSGGSSQMIVNGEKKLYTGRKIPVVFVMYEDEGEPVAPTDPIGKVHCQLSGMHIRESIMGTIKSTARKGDPCDLLGFVDGIQADGYQWITVSYKGVTGYAQFDSRVLWVETN